MNITYQREVDHCEVNPHVRPVTIRKIRPAENSDFLEILNFDEIGWDVLVAKGTYNINDIVYFVPPESVLPLEMSEEMNITKYLHKGRVVVSKLRGNRSEGLVVPINLIERYIPYILKWEDLPSQNMRGDGVPGCDIPDIFTSFYKMPNILNEPYTFDPGESLFISEKIHGTNMRFGELLNPNTNEYEHYVGSHNVVLKENKDNLYWNVYNTFFRDKIPHDVVFYAEIFGPGVQGKWNYDRKKVDVRVFASKEDNERYMSHKDLEALCKDIGIPCVTFTQHTFKDIEDLREIAEQPSSYTTSHCKEGIVIVSKDKPWKMAKCISFKYLESKNRCERH